MFVATLFRAPNAEEKKKADEKRKKGEKIRDRLVRLARFEIDTDSATKAVETVANTISKAVPAKQAVVAAVDIRQVRPKTPDAISW